MPSTIRSVLLDVAGDSASARRALDALIERLRAIPDDQTVQITAETATAQEEIRRLLARLRAVDRTKVTAQANVEITRAILELEAFEHELDDIDGRRVRAHLDVEADRDSIRRALERVRALQGAANEQHDAVQVDLDLKIEDAERDIARIVAEIEAIPEERTVELDARAEELDRELARAEARLAGFEARKRTVEVQFEAQTAKAEADIARLAAEEAALPDSHTIDVRVTGESINDIDRVNDGIGRLVRNLNRATPAGNRFGSEFSNATARISLGFLSFGGALGPIFALVLALIAAIGVSLVAAVAAMVASFAAAAAGAAALGAALIAALGPVLGLFIAVVARIGKVVEAMKAQEAAALQTGVKARQGSQQAAAAAARQAAATRASANAYRELREASVRAYREMEDAAEAASDAIRGVAAAELSLDSARLSIKEAELALREFNETLDKTGTLSEDFQKFTDVSVDFDAGAVNSAVKGAGGSESDALRAERLILNIRDARQAEKEAVDGVSDAERNRTRTLQTHNEFVEKGIAASASYQAALRGVQAAQEQANTAAVDPAPLAAIAKAEELTAKLTRRERQFLAALVEVRNELRGAFRSATDAVFGGMIRALRRAPRLVNPLRGAFAGLGRDVAEALDIFSDELIRPEWISAIRRFIAAGGRIARTFTRGILVGFLRIVRDIALVAMPRLERGLAGAGRALRAFSANNGPREMRDTIDAIIGHLKSWLALTGQLARLFINFTRGAAADGRDLVASLTGKVRELADTLGTLEGRNRLRDFLAEMIPQAKEFVRNIALLTKALIQFSEGAAPAITTLLRLLTKLFQLLNVGGGILLRSPLLTIKNLVTQGSISAVDRARAAVDRLRGAEETLKRAQERGERAVRDLTRARRDARRELLDQAASAAGAKLTKRRAALDVRDARSELRAIQARGGSADELERARLDLAEAELRYRDAARDSFRATKDNAQAQRDGIKGTDTYKSAVDELRASADLTGKAIREMVRAQREASNPPAPNLSAWDQMRAQIGAVATFARGAFDRVWTNIKESASTALDLARATIVGKLVGIVSSVVAAAPRMLAAAGEFIGQFARAAASQERAERWRAAIADFVTGGLRKIAELHEKASEAGRDFGKAIVDGIGKGLSALAGIGRTVINALIAIFNRGIDRVNRAIPDKVRLPGLLPDVDLPNNPIGRHIPELASGGIVSRATAFIAGEGSGTEAVLPLTRRVLRQLAESIMGQVTANFQIAPVFAGGGGGALARPGAQMGRQGPVFPDARFEIKAPAGSYPDARSAMSNFERLVSHVGGDPGAS